MSSSSLEGAGLITERLGGTHLDLCFAANNYNEYRAPNTRNQYKQLDERYRKVVTKKTK